MVFMDMLRVSRTVFRAAASVTRAVGRGLRSHSPHKCEHIFHINLIYYYFFIYNLLTFIRFLNILKFKNKRAVVVTSLRKRKLVFCRHTRLVDETFGNGSESDSCFNRVSSQLKT